MPHPRAGFADAWTPSVVPNKVVVVDSLEDLPARVAGVYTLESDTAYFFTGTVDLLGGRLVTSGASAVLGTTSETSFLTSTGLDSATPLITSAYTLAMRNISIKDVGTGVALSGSASAYDWVGVNFVNVTTVGTAADIGDFILSQSSFLSSQGLKFTGSVGTIAATNCLFSGNGTTADDLIEVTSTATISRRFRLVLCAVVAFGSTSGINVNPSATVPAERFILDTVTFSGGGTYLPGINYASNKALFLRCDNITNTAALGNLYMRNNATVTTIVTIDTPVKAAGTTTANALNQRFSHTSNRLTYTGAFADTFNARAVATVTGGNNKVFGLYFAINGTVVESTEMYATTNAAGRAEAIAILGILQLATDDYVECFIENTTDTSDLTVEFLNFTISRSAP